MLSDPAEVPSSVSDPSGTERHSAAGSALGAGFGVGVAEFRSSMACLASGVTVVSAVWDGRPHAMTATAFTSISLEPPMVMISVGRSSRFHPVVLAAGRWAVSILSGDQQQVARTFARSGRDLATQFDAVATRPAPASRAPLVVGALAWLDCETVATQEAGDHTIVVGHVLATGQDSVPGPPLAYYQGDYLTVT